MFGENKLLDGQRYFVSKVMEYFNTKHPYFYKALQEKRYDSLLLMFHEFLEIDKDLREGPSDKSKLNNSLNSALKSILFHCENNPWTKKGNMSRDIEYLVKSINYKLKNNQNANNKSGETQAGGSNGYIDFAIRTSISSLVKSLNSEKLICEYIDLVLKKQLCFREIDMLVQYFISELIYIGYSLNYLNEWSKQNGLMSTKIFEILGKGGGEVKIAEKII